MQLPLLQAVHVYHGSAAFGQSGECWCNECRVFRNGVVHRKGYRPDIFKIVGIAVGVLGFACHILQHGLCLLQRQLSRFGYTEPAAAFVAIDVHFRSHEYLHGLLRLDPRTAALAPTGTVEQSQLHAFLRGSLEGGADSLPPFVAHKPHFAQRMVVVPPRTGTYVAQKSEVHPGLFHGPDVLSRTLRRDVVAHPVPISAKGDGGRITENLRKGVGRILESALSEILRCGKRDAPVALFVNGTVVVVDHAPPLYDARLVGILVVIRLRSLHKRLACPVGPVYKVVGTGKGVPRLALGFVIPIAAEIEHHPEFSHALQVCVARYAPVSVVQHGVFAIAGPVFHVVAHRHAYAFRLAFGIVVHHKVVAGQPFAITPNGVFVYLVVVPPASVLVFWGEHGTSESVPLVGFSRIAGGVGYANRQVALLISRGVAAEIGHPVLALIAFQRVFAAPCRV